MCTEKMQNRRNRSGGLLPSVFSSSFSFFSFVRTVFLRLERFPPDSFDIAFSDEILEAPLPLAQICTRISIFFRTFRAFLLLSKLVLECAYRPSFTEKPAADKKRKAEVRGGESPDEERREKRREHGTRGAKKAVASLYFSHEFNFQWFLLNCECSR